MIPTALRLQKERQLEVDWPDGSTAVYPIGQLRASCPCASCRIQRDATITAATGEVERTITIGHAPPPRKTMSLSVLPGNYSGPLAVKSASLVGNYALKIEWSDDHGSGIYSFDYLREIAPAAKV